MNNINDKFYIKRALLIGFVLLFMVVVFNKKAKAEPVAKTQPVERTTERAPANLIPEAPSDCLDECIDWNTVMPPNPGKVVCFTIKTKAKKHTYKGIRNGKKWKLVVSTISSKKICRKVRV